MKRYLVAAVLSIWFFGCAPSIRIVQEYQDDSFAAGRISAQTKVRLYVAENVNLMEFVNSYQKEYASDQQFAETMRKQVADSMQRILGCTVSNGDNIQDISALIGGSYDETSVMKMQEFFGAAAEDFFFVVKAVDISNKRTNSAPMYMSTGGMGGGMYVGGGSQESCVVTMHAELWDVKAKKKVLGYTSTGESKVTMFFFGTALKNAVAKSIKYMIKYLATGLTS
ncbi:MAG: hypothetical protein JW699_03265 [Chitinispirillaceae bacterium]|nr:hypothetical protein [Chitinispirillaceae bacterium]